MRTDSYDSGAWAAADESGDEPGTCPACGHGDALPLNVITVAGLRPTWVVMYRCDECAHEWRSRLDAPPWVTSSRA